jgi:hypothetical protein
LGRKQRSLGFQARRGGYGKRGGRARAAATISSTTSST